MRITTKITTGFRVMLIDAILDAGAALWEDSGYGVDNPRQRYSITVEVLAAA